MLFDLSPADSLTRRLWADEAGERIHGLMKAVDGMNAKYGK